MALVAESYLTAVRLAGGRPLLLAPEPLVEGDADRLLDRVDGLLLVGGADIDPAGYGALCLPETEPTVPARDRFELELVRTAFRRNLPVLGICRGLQMMNVATGGSLYQDLAAHGFAEHRPAVGRLDQATHHEVAVDEDSRHLRASTRVSVVNSHHHQGIAALGDGGKIVARAVHDGNIEAVEWPAQRFALGVQWHPEAMALSATIGDLVGAAHPIAPQPS